MHEQYMRRCFELARQGLGRVSPNPLVGAVLVKDGRIIGEGFHARHGAAHAEPDCFANATEDPAGATLYVNLEPCCHTNKLTPPCAPLVISKKVSQVVISNLDPNPTVAGKGVAQLEAAGVKVTAGVLADEGERLNEIFFHRMRTGRPFVTLKTAATLDGKIALPSGESKWITGPEARLDGHWGRLAHDAVMIGAETLRQDDPELTVRIPGVDVERMPWRIVLTKTGNVPSDAKLLQDERVLIVTDTARVPATKARVLRLSKLDPFPFAEFYSKLQELGIHSLYLEGGRGLHSLFMANKQVDRLTLYLNPRIMGAGLSMFTHASNQLSEMMSLEATETSFQGGDLKITGRLKSPQL
jgi:diaminohydroxyphosphoribosylaminopyrimidine deaminase/5-amino-6-(5-phosphoribosylamino)uracil reductase